MDELVGKTVVFQQDSPSGDVVAGKPYVIEGIDGDGDLYITDDRGDTNYYASNPRAKFTTVEESK